MGLDAAQLEVMEAKARLQVKVARTLMKQRMSMAGSVLLVTWLLAMVLLLVWFVLCTVVPLCTVTWAFIIPLLRVEPDFMARANLLGMMAWKLVALLVFLLPGLALKICASAIKTT